MLFVIIKSIIKLDIYVLYIMSYILVWKRIDNTNMYKITGSTTC